MVCTGDLMTRSEEEVGCDTGSSQAQLGRYSQLTLVTVLPASGDNPRPYKLGTLRAMSS